MSVKTPWLEATGEYFHVYNRGVDRSIIFFDDGNYAFFLARMQKYLDPSLPIISYCLMPNHFHLLVRQDSPGAISKYLGLVCKSYVKAINVWKCRTGHLFEGKYKLKHVGEEQYLIHLSRYIHLNPVRARLVKRAEDWIYSSCQDYYGLRTDDLVYCEPLISELGDAATYRKFVEGYIAEDRNKLSEYLF